MSLALACIGYNVRRSLARYLYFGPLPRWCEVVLVPGSHVADPDFRMEYFVLVPCLLLTTHYSPPDVRQNAAYLPQRLPLNADEHPRRRRVLLLHSPSAIVGDSTHLAALLRAQSPRPLSPSSSLPSPSPSPPSSENRPVAAPLALWPPLDPRHRRDVWLCQIVRRMHPPLPAAQRCSLYPPVESIAPRRRSEASSMPARP